MTADDSTGNCLYFGLGVGNSVSFVRRLNQWQIMLTVQKDAPRHTRLRRLRWQLTYEVN